MNMTISEKMREIAPLKATGLDGEDIVQIFLVQSIIIALVVGFIALLPGFSIAYIIDRIPFKITSCDTLPIPYLAADYMMAMVFGLIITVVAS